MTINKIELEGIVGEYTHTYDTKTGGVLFKFSIAAKYGKHNFFISCVIFDTPKARTAATELVHGTSVIVNGQLNESKYTDKSGNERVTMQVIVDSYSILQRVDEDTTALDANNDDLPF